MIIIGAGMAGLIAANMLRKHSPLVSEAQGGLPSNHDALLRFRTTAVQDATGIEFKKLRTRKFINFKNQFADKPNPWLCNLYSQKVTEDISDRSPWNLDEADRWIAPPNFIQLLSTGVNIKYDAKIDTMDQMKRLSESYGPVISTMPMPALMDLVGWENKPWFSYKSIWVFTVNIKDPKINVSQTIYFPDPEVPYYRASLLPGKMIIEFADDPGEQIGDHISDVCDCFALETPLMEVSSQQVKMQKYGKISASSPDACQDFIYTMTRDYNIYSLGRFATWRQILLDDVVEDVRKIEKMIMAEGMRQKYHQHLASVQ